MTNAEGRISIWEVGAGDKVQDQDGGRLQGVLKALLRHLKPEFDPLSKVKEHGWIKILGC